MTDPGAVGRNGVKTPFQKVLVARQHANYNVEAGREFVVAYVEFIHYVERLHVDADGSAHHGGEAPKAEPGTGPHGH